MATNATYDVKQRWSNGNMVEAIVRISGINYTAGTPETIEAVGCGMGRINHITGAMSESKTYVTVGAGTGATTGTLHWFTSNNGSEATADVSAEFCTIRVIGTEGGR